jgi:ABC-type branched-subunit amino acid transport system ATPase component/predicted MFS family arabinose efflux permease
VSERSQRQRLQRHLGVLGEDAPPEPPLRAVVRASRFGWYPLVVLCLLGLIDAIDLQAFVVLGPELKRAFGLSNVEVGIISSLQGLAVVFGALPLAALAARHSRAAIVRLSAAAWGLLQILTGAVRGTFALGLVRTLRGVSDSTRQSVFLPLLTDAYPPDGRNRIFGAYFSVATTGTVVGPAAIAALSTGLSFRAIFPLTGVATLAVAAVALRLRDPGYGLYDTDEIRREVGAEAGVVAGEHDDPPLRLSEAFRRVLAIGTMYRILIGLAVVGVGLYGGGTFLTLFIERQYGLDAFGRGVVLSVLGAASAAGYAAGGVFGERLFRRNPERVLRMLGALLAAYGVVLAVSVHQPSVALFTAGQCLAAAAVAAVLPATFTVVSAIVPPRLRGYSFAVQGIYIGLFGGLLGSVVIGSLADRAGYKVALSLVVLPSLAGGWIMSRAGGTFAHDLDLLTDEIIEDETVRARRARGDSIPLCEVRGCHFFYGSVQVLFGVDFTVEAGSIVALLGTNGAGKSTLLRVISGLGVPRRGTVRFEGRDITYLGAERRVPLGIAHVPSGRPVFPSLSVLENLRTAGFTQEARIERGIEEAFARFPALHERRHHKAATLSGGEQQMLALARASMLRPKLLCVDELSLGLAPKVVADLLEAVRSMREAGTTIVIVEQSVSLALTVADRAYFMEKGEIRFSGGARDLLGRDDLLRAVFLQGAARGVLDA